MASKKKRELSQADEPQSKKEKIEDVTEWSGSMTTQRVVLNPADCNLGIFSSFLPFLLPLGFFTSWILPLGLVFVDWCSYPNLVPFWEL